MMDRTMRQLAILMPVLALFFTSINAEAQTAARKPNFVFIMCDDLGYGDIGCYGQKKIRTPNVDKLAAEGLKFTQYYSGHPVCAPSRCTLMTGLHTGHSYIRDNRGGMGAGKEGQEPIPADTVTVAKLLQREGYATGCVGKWGLGGPDNSGEPNRQGFDFFYGYLCQAVAHNLYPTHLWKNTQKVMLEGNEPKNLMGKHYAHDLMAEEALGFIRQNKDKPFLLYLAWHLPHLAIQAPDDEIFQSYRKAFGDEQPYDGKKGYLPHKHPRAALAAMITRIDRDTGRVMDLLKELKLDDNTIVFFTSDNGGTWELGGVDPTFFQNNGPLRGFKGTVYEGGIRVPMIARWPGKIAAGKETEHVAAHWDVLATLMELAGAGDRTPKGLDSLSFAPTLMGDTNQKKHDHLYWEIAGLQGLRSGDWKAVKPRNKQTIELYNLKEDLAEKNDLAAKEPEIAAKLTKMLGEVRTESELFPLVKQPAGKGKAK